MKDDKNRKNKSNHVTFRLTDEEYVPFKNAIDALGVSRSEFFRLLCINQLDPDIHNKTNSEKYDRLLFLFNKASNNINQLAKQVNTAQKDGLLTEKKLTDWYRKLSIITDNLLAGINRAG